jgi:hypothetical protein
LKIQLNLVDGVLEVLTTAQRLSSKDECIKKEEGLKFLTRSGFGQVKTQPSQAQSELIEQEKKADDNGPRKPTFTRSGVRRKMTVLF